jgi:hypothetical protein
MALSLGMVGITRKKLSYADYELVSMARVMSSGYERGKTSI